MPDANAAFTKPTIAIPIPTSSTTDRPPTIAVAVKDFQTNLTMAYITLRVDGVATTGSASYDAFPDRLSYTPTTNRMLGTHKVEVTAKDANGYSVYRLWTFNIVR